MEDNEESKLRADILLQLAVDEFSDHAPTEVPMLEAISRWANQALEMDPGLQEDYRAVVLFANLYSVLAELYQEDGKKEQAEECHTEAVRYIQAIDDPCWHELWSLGKALAALGRLEEALEAFESAVDLAVPDNSRGHVPDNESLAGIWCDLLDSYVDLERLDKAVECAEWALLYMPKVDPSADAVRTSLILNLLALDRYQDAVKQASIALDNVTTNPTFFRECLAAAASMSGDLATAKETYERVLKEAQDAEARTWYSRMLGYIEGLSDAGGDGERRWNREDWEWWFYSTGDSDENGTAISDMVGPLREEIRDSASRVSLQILQLKDEMARSTQDMPLRDTVRRHLEEDVFGPRWTTLKNATVTSLVEAEVQFEQGRKDGRDDFSSAVTLYVKALELEIKSRVLKPFQLVLNSQGVGTWHIAGKSFPTNNLHNLDLLKLKSLLQDFALTSKRPKSVTDPSKLGEYVNPESSRIMSEFLGGLTQSQRDFLIAELKLGLESVSYLAREAKHIGPVPRKDAISLRASIIVNQMQPGLLPKFVQLFPVAS